MINSLARIRHFMACGHDDGDDGSGASQAGELLYRHPVHMIFKHSPVCPISGMAGVHVGLYATMPNAVRVTVVDVLSQRALSRGIAAATQVRHESAQVLLVSDALVRWHVSHGGLTTTALLRATRDA